MSSSSRSCELFVNQGNRDMKVLKLKDFLDWEPRCEDLNAEGEESCKVHQPSVVTWLQKGAQFVQYPFLLVPAQETLEPLPAG